MGSRLGELRGGLETDIIEQDDALERGEEIVEEVGEINGTLDGIDTSNVDDETAAQVEIVRENARAAAREDLEGDVGARVEEANSDALSISDDATVLEQGSREAADQFSQVASTEFGSSGSEGVATANREAEEAADLSSEAQERSDSALARLEALESQLGG